MPDKHQLVDGEVSVWVTFTLFVLTLCLSMYSLLITFVPMQISHPMFDLILYVPVNKFSIMSGQV